MIPTLDNPKFYELKKQANIQNMLSQIDPFVLMQKIAKFRKLNISKMSCAEIDQARVLIWLTHAFCLVTIAAF